MAENEAVVVDEKLVETEDLSQLENPDSTIQETINAVSQNEAQELANASDFEVISFKAAAPVKKAVNAVKSVIKVWPVKPGKGVKNTLYISEKFGVKRNGGRVHNGVDFGTQSTPGHIAKAYKKGVVIMAFVNDAPRGSGFGGYGKVVVLKHDDGTVSIYAHLASLASKIESVWKNISPTAIKQKSGNVPKITIDQNEAVGIIGKSGSCYGGSGPYAGTHLHFEVRRNNQPIKPDLPTGGKYKCANGKDTKWYV